MSFGKPLGVTVEHEGGFLRVQFSTGKDGLRRNVVQCYTDEFRRCSQRPWWEHFAGYCADHRMPLSAQDLEALLWLAGEGEDEASELDWYLAS